MKDFIFVITADENPMSWTYVLDGNSVEEIINRPCYKATNRKSVPKSGLGGTKVRTFGMLDCISGNNSNGTIYKIAQNRFAAKRISILSLTLFILLFCSCKTNYLLFRYQIKNSTQINSAEVEKLVDVNASCQNIPPAPNPDPPTIISLNTTTQKKIIEEIGKKTKFADSLLYFLSVPLQSNIDNSPSFLSEKLKFTKRFFIAVSDKSPFPADRISKLSITLTDITGRINITGCDKISTDYQTVDLGNVSYKNTISGELNANASSGGTINNSKTSSNRNSNNDTVTNTRTSSINSGLGASGKLGFNSEVDADAKMKQRYVSLAASISDHSISFYQESAVGIDLTGTIISDISFEFPKDNSAAYTFYSFEKLYDKDKKPNKAENISVNQRTIVVPNINRDSDILLNLSYEIVYRKVTGNDNKIVEGNHNVSFLYGKSGAAVHKTTLIRASEVLPKKWVLFDNAAKKNINIGIGNNNGDMYFDSYQSGQKFLSWLIKSVEILNKPLGDEGYNLTNNNNPITKADIKNLEIIASR